MKYLKIFALITAICLSAFSICLWSGYREPFVLAFGLTVAIMSGIGILSIPITNPKLMQAFNHWDKSIEQNPLPPQSFRQKFVAFGFTVLFVSIGFWVCMYFFEPETFVSDFPRYLWIIPITMIFSLSYFRR